MRLRVQLGLVVALWVLPCTAHSQTTNGGGVYLLLDPSSNSWCAYRDPAAWKERVKVVDSPTTAVASYIDNHVYAVKWYFGDEEGGDWRTEDQYLLDADGRVAGLDRDLKLLSSRVDEKQIFIVVNGTPFKIFTFNWNLDTSQPLGEITSAWVPSLTVNTRIQQFPFWPTLKAGIPGATDGHVCRPAEPAMRKTRPINPGLGKG